MLQLALILLTGELPEGFKLSQPGTVSKARIQTLMLSRITLVQTLLECEAFQILWYVADEFTGE